MHSMPPHLGAWNMISQRVSVASNVFGHVKASLRDPGLCFVIFPYMAVHVMNA